MHDFILSAVGREAHITNADDLEAVPQPRSVSFSNEQTSIYCPWCSEIVDLLNAREAAEAFNTDIQDIIYLLKAAKAHALREDSATIAICRRSLELCFETRRTRLLDSYFELKFQEAEGEGS